MTATLKQVLEYINHCKLEELNYLKGAIETNILKLDENQFKGDTKGIDY